MTLLMSPLPNSISHRHFRCRYSNCRDVVAGSPSFSRPVARAPRRLYFSLRLSSHGPGWNRLQNSRFFFLSKSVRRAVRVLRAQSARASHARKAYEAREKKLSLALRFQPRSRHLVWLLARTWIRKNTDCFTVYGWVILSHGSTLTSRKCTKI